MLTRDGKDSWPQEIADQVHRTIKYLAPITKQPNQYTEVGRFSNASEIYRLQLIETL